jgi:L-alanine-DL-glutamate epimerase-like enolase superfamily enzyme
MSGECGRLLDLPLHVETCELVPLERPLSDGLRCTTLVRLCGKGEEGLGEDVTFDTDDRRALLEAGLPDEVRGARTVGDVEALLEERDLTMRHPRWEAVRRYRRWAVEAAALDLALRQAGLGLAEALGRTPAPLQFVVSQRADDVEHIRELLDRHPGVRLKLDLTPAWTETVASAIASTAAVATVDLKGTAPGSSVYCEPDPVLYERVARLFPDAWLEDPGLTPETAQVLAPHRRRISWDEPIGSAADVPDDAGAVNIKPARIGSIRGVLSVLDRCTMLGIPTYGGGQSEIGPGRGQAQLLAALFSPAAPNDLAPIAYNEAGPSEGLPSSPLEPGAGITGFCWS